MVREGYTLWTHASGVGWSFVISNNLDHTAPLAGQFGGLEGRRQTVNRSELMALRQALKHTKRLVHFVTDSSYVETGWRKLARGSIPSTNVDLWKAVRAETEGRNIKIYKVESHLDEATVERRAQYAPEHIRINIMADVHAEEAAVGCQIDPLDASLIDYNEDIVKNVQDRLIAVTEALQEQDKREDLQNLRRQRRERQA